MVADLGLTRLREQHTRDRAITSICGECGWPFPCATVRLLDRLAALEGALLEAHFHTRPSFDFPNGREGAPGCTTCELLGVPIGYGALPARALAGTPKP